MLRRVCFCRICRLRRAPYRKYYLAAWAAGFVLICLAIGYFRTYYGLQQYL